MKNNRILNIISMIILSWLVLYLIGSFGNADFNIKTWEPGSRGFICIIAGFCAIFSVVMTYDEQLRK